tara:strand:- start:195 stop:335 length:141 start_codon:yes stop_codon:yes gene_type:complete
MLFEYGKFWQTITIIVVTWIMYAIFGFEFICATLLALLLTSQINER